MNFSGFMFLCWFKLYVTNYVGSSFDIMKDRWRKQLNNVCSSFVCWDTVGSSFYVFMSRICDNYCKFGNFHENFIFAKSFKGHICDVKIRD